MAKRKVRKAPDKIAKRNPVAQNPLLSKCTVHQKSDKALRRAANMKMRKAWHPQSTDERCCVLPISRLVALAIAVCLSQTGRVRRA